MKQHFKTHFCENSDSGDQFFDIAFTNLLNSLLNNLNFQMFGSHFGHRSGTHFGHRSGIDYMLYNQEYHSAIKLLTI